MRQGGGEVVLGRGDKKPELQENCRDTKPGRTHPGQTHLATHLPSRTTLPVHASETTCSSARSRVKNVEALLQSGATFVPGEEEGASSRGVPAAGTLLGMAERAPARNAAARATLLA